jgi:hypothetical protein
MAARVATARSVKIWQCVRLCCVEDGRTPPELNRKSSRRAWGERKQIAVFVEDRRLVSAIWCPSLRPLTACKMFGPRREAMRKVGSDANERDQSGDFAGACQDIRFA